MSGHHRRRTAVATRGPGLLAVLAALGLAASLETPPALGATTVARCTYAGVKAAVSKGGDVRFDCSGSIRFTRAITIAGGRSVTLDGSGRTVTFDGRGRNQLFIVAGGGRLVLVN